MLENNKEREGDKLPVFMQLIFSVRRYKKQRNEYVNNVMSFLNSIKTVKQQEIENNGGDGVLFQMDGQESLSDVEHIKQTPRLKEGNVSIWGKHLRHQELHGQGF